MVITVNKGLAYYLSGMVIISSLFLLVENSLAQSPSIPAKQPNTANVQIDRNGILILVRSTLLALEHANKTGNYTVFRDLGSLQFQANTALQLGEIFYGLKKEGIDLSGTAVMEPQFISVPEINSSGMLHINGYYQSIPKKISFDLTYAPVSGEWRLFSLKVSTDSALPVAPNPANQVIKSTDTKEQKPTNKK